MKVAAVVVTYNRLNMLKECISALKNQTRKLEEIIIVNNSSTDGTSEWLNAQNDLYVITQNNLGGAGGFYQGIKIAYERGFDWIWCMDDDVKPRVNALEEKIIYIDTHTSKKIAAISAYRWDLSLATYLVDEILEFNAYAVRPRNRFVVGTSGLYHKSSEMQVYSSTFEGILIHHEAIHEVGFPNKDFFIGIDDTEYCSRLRRYGVIIHLGSSVFEKLLPSPKKKEKSMQKDLWKWFYCIRNVTWWQLHSTDANRNVLTFLITRLFILLYLWAYLRYALTLKQGTKQ